MRGFDCGEEKEGNLIYSTKTEFIKKYDIRQASKRARNL